MNETADLTNNKLSQPGILKECRTQRSAYSKSFEIDRCPES